MRRYLKITRKLPAAAAVGDFPSADYYKVKVAKHISTLFFKLSVYKRYWLCAALPMLWMAMVARIQWTYHESGDGIEIYQYELVIFYLLWAPFVYLIQPVFGGLLKKTIQLYWLFAAVVFTFYCIALLMSHFHVYHKVKMLVDLGSIL